MMYGAPGQIPPEAFFVEHWHCPTCEVIFDSASAGENGGMVACPRCGRVNLGYVCGPGGADVEEIEVIDEPKPDVVKTPKDGPAAELLELVAGELERLTQEERQATEDMERADLAAKEARWHATRIQQLVSAAKEFIARLNAVDQAQPARRR